MSTIYRIICMATIFVCGMGVGIIVTLRAVSR